MRSTRSKKMQVLVVGFVVSALAVATYAFTAANTVATSKAGDGAGAVSGYTMDEVDYTLNAANPQTIDTVTTDVNGTVTAGSTAKAQLDSTGGTWYTCAIGAADSGGAGETRLTCTTTGQTVVDADSFRVVIAD